MDQGDSDSGDIYVVDGSDEEQSSAHYVDNDEDNDEEDDEDNSNDDHYMEDSYDSISAYSDLPAAEKQCAHKWVENVLSEKGNQKRDDDASVSKRQCTDERCVELEMTNTNLKKEIDFLAIKLLDAQRLIQRLGGPHAPPVQDGYFSFSSVQPTSVRNVRKIVLRQIIRTPDGRDLTDIAAPYRFSNVGAFPHAIDYSTRDNTRQYQLESRRVTNFTFLLFYDDDNKHATERDLNISGLKMQLSMHYADDHTAVCPEHFTRAAVENLVNPAIELDKSKTMENGEVSFSVRFCVQSTETSPRNRAFVMRVGPSLGSKCSDDNLICYTPPFVIRSKVTANAVQGQKEKLIPISTAPQNTRDNR